MDGERALFEAALERPHAERAAFVAAAGGDERLQRRVLALLAAHEDAATLRTAGAVVQSFEDLSLLAGKEFDGYRLREPIGAGGMGIVFEAEQDSPRRRVAVKLMQPSLLGTGTRRRFEVETEALGRLQHPGIAQIHGAGTANLGLGEQPYFAMEFVDGLPLLAAADQAALTFAARLELLAGLCDAVQHAHQHGVIHRDLKPDNVLVTRLADGRLQPKVLDFGVARATDRDVQAATMHTHVGEIVGTLPYMSPEQVAGRREQVDTRADVYALGVIAYQLLAGQLPIDVDGTSVFEAVERIQRSEPVPLGRLRPSLGQDIELVVQKALAKDREQRYGSVAALADDLRSVLAHEPIRARPPSAIYQLRKFARRHRAAVTTAAFALLALLAAAIVATWQAVRANEAADAVGIENQKLFALNQFYEGVLTGADPERGLGEDVRVVAAMRDAAQRVERVALPPAAKGAVHAHLGAALLGAGDPEAAEPHLQQAVAILREHDRGLVLVAALKQLASLHVANDRYADAEPLLEQALAILAPLPDRGVEHADIRQELAVAAIRQGEHERAELLLRSVIRDKQRLDAAHAGGRNLLAHVLGQLGRLDEAEREYRIVLADRERRLGREHPRVAATLNGLALVLQLQKRFDDAFSIWERLIEIDRSQFADHPNLVTTLSNAADTFFDGGAIERALACADEAVRLAERVVGTEHSRYGSACRIRAKVYAHLQRYDDAIVDLRAATTTLRAIHPDGHGAIVSTLLWLASTQKKMARFAAARGTVAEARDEVARAGRMHATVVAALEVEDAEAALALAQHTAAIRSASAGMAVEGVAHDGLRRRAVAVLVAAHEALGEHDRARHWRAQLEPDGGR